MNRRPIVILTCVALLGGALLRPDQAEARPSRIICRDHNAPCVDVNRDEQMSAFPESEEIEEHLSIQVPFPDRHFTFDGSDPGVLRINARAVALPEEYEAEITWKIDDIGSISAEIVPETGPQVEIVFRGLPDKNTDFGPKVITASVRGLTDTVEVKVFFHPTARNNPDGDVPNWVYYWRQTTPGRLVDFKYLPSPRDGRESVGRYVYDEDRIYLFDILYSQGCLMRNSGIRSTGIDCFAETLIHEQVHRIELREWWGPLRWHSPSDLGSSAPLVVAMKRGWDSWAFRVDHDFDLVPTYVERALEERGCAPDNSTSCQGRPRDYIEDVDMNAYEISWSTWRPGAANQEDWSAFGKQW